MTGLMRKALFKSFSADATFPRARAAKACLYANLGVMASTSLAAVLYAVCASLMHLCSRKRSPLASCTSGRSGASTNASRKSSKARSDSPSSLQQQPRMRRASTVPVGMDVSTVVHTSAASRCRPSWQSTSASRERCRVMASGLAWSAWRRPWSCKMSMASSGRPRLHRQAARRCPAPRGTSEPAMSDCCSTASRSCTASIMSCADRPASCPLMSFELLISCARAAHASTIARCIRASALAGWMRTALVKQPTAASNSLLLDLMMPLAICIVYCVASSLGSIASALRQSTTASSHLPRSQSASARRT
mmetsp:Transcript_18966/g.48650  ORF Transcript_18966/g.48650 Transcript_18966/m.48650 type:complete len:307 (+) Transcript_18966:1199-2119(+)